jgi:hypothetical protein
VCGSEKVFDHENRVKRPQLPFLQTLAKYDIFKVPIPSTHLASKIYHLKDERQNHFLMNNIFDRGREVAAAGAALAKRDLS